MQGVWSAGVLEAMQAMQAVQSMHAFDLTGLSVGAIVWMRQHWCKVRAEKDAVCVSGGRCLCVCAVCVSGARRCLLWVGRWGFEIQGGR